MALEDFLTPGKTILRNTPIKDGMGGWKDDWNPHLQISGVLDQLSGSESKIAAQYVGKATHILICSTGIDIESTDRVEEGGEVFEILDIDDPLRMGKHWEILLEKVVK